MFDFLRRSKATAPEADMQLIATDGEQRGISETSTLNDPADWLFGLFGSSPTYAEIEVGPRTALQVPAVRAAVELIAGTLNTLPVSLYRPSDGGGKEEAVDHPAFDLIRRTANPWTSAGALRQQLSIDAMLVGNGRAIVVRDSAGVPQELIRATLASLTVEIDVYTGEPRYILTAQPAYNADISTQNGSQVYSYKDVIDIAPICHLNPTLGFENFGLAPIKSAKEAIALCIALERYAARLMATGGRPSGILSFAGQLGEKATKKMQESWRRLTSGFSSGGTAIIEEGGVYTPLAFSSVDSQFQQMREFEIIEIARTFAIPPSLIGDFSRATWNNADAAFRQFVLFCLKPWAKSWTDAYDRCLLTDADRKAGLYTAFDFDCLLDGNLIARAQAYQILITSRVLNPNEARAREHLPAYPEGDVFANPNTTIGGMPGGQGTPTEKVKTDD